MRLNLNGKKSAFKSTNQFDEELTSVHSKAVRTERAALDKDSQGDTQNEAAAVVSTGNLRVERPSKELISGNKPKRYAKSVPGRSQLGSAKGSKGGKGLDK